ncbi:HTH-type transcriptional regulator PgrR [Burkholderiaceae bacterium]|nr:HTH-type transcriptional regulator PgrR [Burkholderiaceae bacterium]
MSRQFDDVMLGSIELFCLCAELQGFTAAAAAAGLTPPAVSRSVSRLEERLGVKLFTRTTRQVRLTDSGRAYFQQCRQALNQLVEAEREVTGRQAVPSGTLRISLPTSYGHCRVLPLLAQFHARHPDVKVEVQLSNHNVDFAADGFDLAVRGREPPDSGLVARRLEDAPLVVVAAPAYLKRRGVPKSIDDLAGHDCIQFLLPRTGLPVPWLFRLGGEEVEIATRGSFTCSEDILGGVTLARHGAGVLQTYRFIVEDDLQRGVLKEVLPKFAGASRPFSLIYPGNRHMPLRVRVFIDFLVDRLKAPSSAGRPAAAIPPRRG